MTGAPDPAAAWEAKVTIDRVYLVNCGDCGPLGDAGSVLTKSEADRVRREHAEWHVREDGEG